MMDISLFRVYGMSSSSIRLINGLLRQSIFAGPVVALPQHVPFLVALETLLFVAVVLEHLRGHVILKFTIFCLVSLRLHDSSLVLLLLLLLLAGIGIFLREAYQHCPSRPFPVPFPLRPPPPFLVLPSPAVPDEDAPWGS